MPDRVVRMTRLAGWCAIVTLATYCLLIGGSWNGIYDADIRRLSLFLAGVGVAGWLILAAYVPSWRPRSVLAWAFVGALAVLTISTMTSKTPRLGLEYVAWSILLTTLYLLLQRLMDSSFFRPRMMAFATMYAFIVGMSFVVAVAMKWATWWDLVGQITAPPLRPAFESLTFGNPSAVMTASVLLTATAVCNLAGRSRRRGALALAAILLSLLVTLLSGSRAGWLALTLACVLTTGLWLFNAEHRTSLADLVRSRIVRLMLMPALIGAIGVTALIGPGMLVRAAAGGEAQRGSFFAASVRMFESSPLVGLGPGTWAAMRPQFTFEGELDYYIPHAHNIYLQTAAEMGILGLTVGVLVAVLLGRLLYRAVRDSDPARRRVGWGVIFATTYFAAHQVLDFYANAPSILFAFAIPIAWLDATSPQVPQVAMTPSTVPNANWHAARRSIVVGVGAALIVSVAVLGWVEAGAATMKFGTDRLDAGQAAAGLPVLSAVVADDPLLPPYRFALGLALAEVGELQGAEREFLASATVDDLPEAWLDLAAVRARLGDVPGSRDALARAMRLGSQQVGIVLGVGVTLLQLGDREAATAAFVQALTLSPSLAGDAWWSREPLRAEIWPTVYEIAFQKSSAAGRFELAVETGDKVAAAAAIEQTADPAYQATARAVLAAWRGDPAAIARLEALATSRPLDVSIVNWLARLHGRLGLQDAQKYRTWLRILNSGVTDELRVSDGRISGVIAGTSTLYYGHYGYRRPTPRDQFVPWLPDLVGL